MSAYVHVQPAFYFTAIVKTDVSLGVLSTGGQLARGRLVRGRISSEPGFKTELSCYVVDGDDYIVIQPDGEIMHPNLNVHLQPDDGDTPLQMTSSGISAATPDIVAITTTNTTMGKAIPYGASYSVWNVNFRGGSRKYLNLQNSFFVASVTVSDGENPDEFVVGFKICKVYNTETKVIIGEESKA